MRRFLPPRRLRAAARASWWWRTIRWCGNFVVARLHGLGYRTIAAADSRAAMALVENGEPFDLLFTDVILSGGMTGRQLADAVAKHRPGLKVLYASGYTDNSIVHHGRLDQGVLLLTKPYRKTQLA
jgi:CheY-like chemotaxis protein